MASEAHVILVDPRPGADGYALRRLEQLERCWSRFVNDSDVSRLNCSAEALMLVSPDTIALLDAMKHAKRLTNGRYEPAVLDAMVATGYTRSVDGSGRTSRAPGSPPSGAGIDAVAIDSRTSAVTVPAGLGIDPGGIGKGLAADVVATELLAQGTRGALVAIGGDIAAVGSPPEAAGWYVTVEDPFDSTRVLTTLALDAGGLATSSTLSRTWLQDGHRRHHVIDPGTGTCSTTDLAAVTVVARAGWEAEAHATAALLSGSERVVDYLAARRLTGIATTLDGTTTSTGLDGARDEGRGAA